MRKWLVVILISVAYLVTTAPLRADSPPLSPKMYAIYERAEAAFEAGRFREAMIDYERVAIDGGNDSAAFQMGWMYHQGLGVPVDLGEAARWYTFAANSRNAAAMNNLSILYLHGAENFPANEVAAHKWLVRAAEAGLPIAQANLAERILKSPDASKWHYEAYDLARRSSAQDNARGHFMLAKCFENGYGVPKSLLKAASHNERCANLSIWEIDLATGQSCSMYLAAAYAKGLGVVPNQRRAFAWGLASLAGPELVSDKLRRDLLRPQKSLSAAAAAEIQQKVSAWQATTVPDARERIMNSIGLAPTEEEEAEPPKESKKVSQLPGPRDPIKTK